MIETYIATKGERFTVSYFKLNCLDLLSRKSQTLPFNMSCRHNIQMSYIGNDATNLKSFFDKKQRLNKKFKNITK